eukprot:TRINITY_DN17193_c0_g1_i1.p1 TRINITY_DN17193_c0_g1~~TRINITY_DN17193_c0_g1_i1.p1  ORF type:complete len:149 (-),score=2.90 TRINITY_DN17193_c0_g1_i1:882-1328(-)
MITTLFPSSNLSIRYSLVVPTAIAEKIVLTNPPDLVKEIDPQARTKITFNEEEPPYSDMAILTVEKAEGEFADLKGRTAAFAAYRNNKVSEVIAGSTRLWLDFDLKERDGEWAKITPEYTYKQRDLVQITDSSLFHLQCYSCFSYFTI